MNLNKTQKNKLPSSIHNRIAWVPAGIDSCAPLFRRLQQRLLFGSKNFSRFAAGPGKPWGKKEPKGVYLPLSLNWFSLIRPIQSGNINYLSVNPVMPPHSTRPSVLRLNFLFLQKMRVEHFTSQRLPDVPLGSERHLIDSGGSSPDLKTNTATLFRYEQGLHSARDREFVRIPKKSRSQPSKTNRITMDVILKTRLQVNTHKVQALALHANKSPRKEIPVSHYRAANQANAEPVFRPHQSIFDQSFNVSDRSKENTTNNLPVKSSGINMIDQLFDLGMESMPMREFSLRELSGEKDTIAVNKMGETDAVSAISPAEAVTRTSRTITLDSNEITHIADKVSRLLQQRERFERERRGYF